MLSELCYQILRAVDAKNDPGRWAERHALNLLKRRGWRCLAERWSCRYGELDLMMIKSGRSGLRLLIVEVKARRRCGLDGWGVKAFAAAKRNRLARTVGGWQSCHPWSDQGQLEVVLALVPLPSSSRPVRWIRVPELQMS